MNTAVFLALAALGANVFNESFDDGVKAYEAGEYVRSAEVFEGLVKQKVIDSAVFYNLGNAYYRQGNLGEAIVNYERALQLDPTLKVAQENLNRSVRQTRRHLAKPLPSDLEQAFLGWHYGVPRATSARVAAFGWVGVWLLLAVRQRYRVRYLRRGALALGLIAIASGTSAWVKWHPEQLAVACEAEIPVYYGKNESETVRFELFEGDRVKVGAIQNDWARVVTAEGETGWARASQFAFVNPPYRIPSSEDRS
jgi:tetratricopeptide (TPR) repeat protein